MVMETEELADYEIRTFRLLTVCFVYLQIPFISFVIIIISKTIELPKEIKWVKYANCSFRF